MSSARPFGQGLGGDGVDNRDVTDSREELLGREVFVGDHYVAFGKIGSADASALAERFRGLSGGGLEQMVAPVGRAWLDLAELIEERGVGSVAELGDAVTPELAERLRVVPPGGSWL
jgi:hypothetical protein